MIGLLQAFVSAAILGLFAYCVSISIHQDTWQKVLLFSAIEISTLFGILFCIWDGLKSLVGMSFFFARSQEKKTKKSKSTKKVKNTIPKKESKINHNQLPTQPKKNTASKSKKSV
jgi:hypothetical protein